MSDQKQIVIDRLSGRVASPALRKMAALARSDDTHAVGTRPATMRTEDALGIWSVRLRAARAAGNNIFGLNSLVRQLATLPAGHIIQQIGLKSTEESGVVFFDPSSQIVLGAVVTKRSAADEARSQANFDLAMDKPNTTRPDEPNLRQAYGTARVRNSIARVFLRPGLGKFTVNGKRLEHYFILEAHRTSAVSPLVAVDVRETFDILSTVVGGSVNSQAEAVMLSIARALIVFDDEFRDVLLAEGFTSDGRGRRHKKRVQKSATALHQR